MTALFVILAAYAHSALAANYSKSFVDPNYAACEGVGAHASGKLTVSIKYAKEGKQFRITDVLLIGKYQMATGFSGRLLFRNERGVKQQMKLQRPWYSILKAPNSLHLTNPQVRTTAKPGIDDKQEFVVGRSGVIMIETNTLIVTRSGSCPSSFAQQITLK